MNIEQKKKEREGNRRKGGRRKSRSDRPIRRGLILAFRLPEKRRKGFIGKEKGGTRALIILAPDPSVELREGKGGEREKEINLTEFQHLNHLLCRIQKGKERESHQGKGGKRSNSKPLTFEPGGKKGKRGQEKRGRWIFSTISFISLPWGWIKKNPWREEKELLLQL